MYVDEIKYIETKNKMNNIVFPVLYILLLKNCYFPFDLTTTDCYLCLFIYVINVNSCCLLVFVICANITMQRKLNIFNFSYILLIVF